MASWTVHNGWICRRLFVNTGGPIRRFYRIYRKTSQTRCSFFGTLNGLVSEITYAYTKIRLPSWIFSELMPFKRFLKTSFENIRPQNVSSMMDGGPVSSHVNSTLFWSMSTAMGTWITIFFSRPIETMISWTSWYSIFFFANVKCLSVPFPIASILNLLGVTYFHNALWDQANNYVFLLIIQE